MLVRSIAGLGLCATLAAPALAQEVPSATWTVRDLHTLTCCSRAQLDSRWTVSEAPSTELLGGELRSSSAHSISPSGDVEADAMNVSLRYPVGSVRLYLQGVFGAASAAGAGVTRMQPAGEHVYIGQRRLFHQEVSLGYRLTRDWGLEAAYVRTSPPPSQRLQNMDYPSNSLGLRLAFRVRR